MTKKPREKRREKKVEETSGLWITVMGQLPLGGLAAVLTALLVLLICSLLVSGGAVPERAMDRAEHSAGGGRSGCHPVFAAALRGIAGL